MENQSIINMIVDGCSLVFLLILLMPCFADCSGRTINRRKRSLLLYAMLTHLFVLLLRIIGAVSIRILAQPRAAELFTGTAIFPTMISAGLMTLSILCDNAGRIRIPKGKEIPVGQISCVVLPLFLAWCLRAAFPAVNSMGLAWTVALQLNQSLIQIDSEKRIDAVEQRLSRDQALLMTVQMQPHFIFNTLSSIESLCQTDAVSAAESIQNLSGYLRSNLDALTSESLIPFDDELRHVRQYIALELADPARQFLFEYELDVRNFLLPALTVQPIVENAVKHGALTHRDGSGRVMLSTEELGSYVRITVTDNGKDNSALTEAQRQRRGVGIENTQKRLAALCGGSLEYSTGETGTKAVILLPRKGG